MNLEAAPDEKKWEEKVRKVDSSIHAVLAKQSHAVPKPQPFWRRLRMSGSGTERQHAFQGSRL